MQDIKWLIDKADDLLERNDFLGAQELYRKSLLMGTPTGPLLGNLSVAENQERLQFRQAIANKYPDSIHARLSEAEALLSANYATQATDLCTELLKSDQHNIRTEILIRLLRYRSASLSGSYEIMIIDFKGLWAAGNEISSAKSFRAGLLKKISSLNQIDAVPALETLVNENNLSQEVREFITTKILELKLLVSSMGSD